MKTLHFVMDQDRLLRRVRVYEDHLYQRDHLIHTATFTLLTEGSETEQAYLNLQAMLSMAVQNTHWGMEHVIFHTTSSLVAGTLMGGWKQNPKVFGYSEPCLRLKQQLIAHGITVSVHTV